MSSKFHGRSKVQKPPAVCRKPPVPLIIPSPPFDERYWQSFAFWDDVGGSESIAATDYFTLSPTIDPYTWEGENPNDNYYLKLRMVWVPGSETLQTTLSLMLAGVASDFRQSPPQHPKTFLPFDSGLIQYQPAPYSGAITARIMD